MAPDLGPNLTSISRLGNRSVKMPSASVLSSGSPRAAATAVRLAPSVRPMIFTFGSPAFHTGTASAVLGRFASGALEPVRELVVRRIAEPREEIRERLLPFARFDRPSGSRGHGHVPWPPNDVAVAGHIDAIELRIARHELGRRHVIVESALAILIPHRPRAILILLARDGKRVHRGVADAAVRAPCDLRLRSGDAGAGDEERQCGNDAHGAADHECLRVRAGLIFGGIGHFPDAHASVGEQQLPGTDCREPVWHNNALHHTSRDVVTQCVVMPHRFPAIGSR